MDTGGCGHPELGNYNHLSPLTTAPGASRLASPGLELALPSTGQGTESRCVITMLDTRAQRKLSLSRRRIWIGRAERQL